jgi:phosphoserine phosphatase
MAVIFFDFDSTVVKKETLDDAIAAALDAHPEKERLVREVEEITRLGMEGKMNFLDSVRARLRVVPLSKQLLEKCGETMLDEITDGMSKIFLWLRQHGHGAHIVSGGFAQCIAPVAHILGIEEKNRHTNRFLFDERDMVVCTDETSLLWTNEGKTSILRALRTRYPTETFVIIGDGMNDYRAYEAGAADMFCGFGANVVRESVRAKAPHFFHSAYELLDFFKKELQ